jgi:protein-S-isoprenylcysteine O-methyltransferase Ste14
MFIPIFLISIPALSIFQPYGSLIWLAGVVFLWLTRYTHQLGQRWGRFYYGLSVVIRPLGILLIAFGWLVLYAPSPSCSWRPYQRFGFLPLHNWAEVLCWLAILLFFALGVWSVIVLGIRRSFLFRHVDDPLIKNGPYAMVRHPQFLSAIGIAFFGTLLFNPTTFYYSSIICFPHLSMNCALFILALWLLSIIEEHELLAHFGDQYREYMRQVPRLFPN